MDDAKLLTLPDISEAFMKTADVLLVLDDGVAIQCYSQILAMHSTVLCNMLADLSSQNDEIFKVPLADFTEAQCSAVLAYLYSVRRGAAFEGHGAAKHDAAVAVARFAHAYDVPHALRHVEAYLTGFMDVRFKTKDGAGLTGETCDKVVLAWALMADKFDMHELCGHCERAMVMYWEHFLDKPELVDQLSSSAFQRIAKGLHKTMATLVESASNHYNDYHYRNQGGHMSFMQYPKVCDFIAWRRQKQPTAH